jgi:hypothetical protein
MLDLFVTRGNQDRHIRNPILKAFANLWGNDTIAQKVAYQRYLMQLAYTDSLLGKLMAAMKYSGRYKNALVIVAADHGSNISPVAGFRYATPDNFRNIMSVPLFIKYPQQTSPGLDDSNVQLIDILPSIADVLQINSGWAFSGRSLFEARKLRYQYPAILAETSGTVSFGKESETKRRLIITPMENPPLPDGPDHYEALIPKWRHLSVFEGEHVEKGEVVSEGTWVPPAVSPVKQILSSLSDSLLTIPEAEARQIFATDERNNTLVDSLGEMYLFDMSSDRTWLDRQVAELTVIQSLEKANIPAGDLLGNVDTKGDSLPGLLRFEVGHHLFATSTEFAAALNGVIFATTRLSPAGMGMFDVIVPEQLFRQGKNDLALYIINKKAEPAVFQQLELTYDK